MTTDAESAGGTGAEFGLDPGTAEDLEELQGLLDELEGLTENG